MDAVSQQGTALPASFTVNSGPLLLVISGPSGAGKDSILEGLQSRGVEFYRAITAVTREPRPKEVHGTHHYFLTSAEFDRWEAEGKFLETATVYGHRYGTPLQEVIAAMDCGKDVVLRVDVQGAATVRQRIPESIHIYIGVPGLSLETLRQRRDQRGLESPAERSARDSLLRDELAAIPRFDYLVENESGAIDRAVDQVIAIITAEKCRISPRG